MDASAVVSVNLGFLPEDELEKKELESKYEICSPEGLGLEGGFVIVGLVTFLRKGAVLNHRDGWNLWHELNVSVWRKGPCVCIRD